jgi:hypothetical protein
MEMGSRQGIPITRTDGLKCQLRKLLVGLMLGKIKKHSITGKIVFSGAKVQTKGYTTVKLFK